MSAPKRRGRPPSAKTLKARQIDEWLSNPPPHIKSLTEAERAAFEESFEHNERIRQQILKDFKHGRSTPDSHAYSMESLGDEMLSGHEGKILADDQAYRERAQRYREAGARQRRQEASRSAKQTCEKYKDLLQQLEPLGPLTITQVTRRMHEEWDKRRNDGDPPSERTLQNYIRRASPFPEHRSGKTSSK
jgi:hypothetical protein